MFTQCLILLVILAASVPGGVIATELRAPQVEFKWTHTILLSVDPDNVPEGANVVEIQAEEVDDLTGIRFEAGYKFGYNALYPMFYYPQLDSGKDEKFRVRYSSDGIVFGKWSRTSQSSRAENSKVELRNTERNFNDAKNMCLEEGKRLVTVHSKKQNDKLVDLMKDSLPEDDDTPAYIGLYDDNYVDDNPKTHWEWVDGSKFHFSNWQYGIDVGSSVEEKSAVVLNLDGNWERVNPGMKMHFFCESGKEEKPDIAVEHKRGIDANTILREAQEHGMSL